MADLHKHTLNAPVNQYLENVRSHSLSVISCKQDIIEKYVVQCSRSGTSGVTNLGHLIGNTECLGGGL